MPKKIIQVFKINLFVIIFGFFLGLLPVNLILIKTTNFVQAVTESVSQQTTEIESDSSYVELANPLRFKPKKGGDLNAVMVFLMQIVNKFLGILGGVIFLAFVYGGILWVLSAGEETKVKKGKDILLWTSVGLLVIFSSYAIINLILDNLKL